MKLVWHILAKDLRRLGWPVAGWLLLHVVSTIWMRWLAAPGGVPAGAIEAWLGTISWMATLAKGFLLVMGFVLAGALVVEDPVGGSNAFWPTRPISNGRLLSAKALGALLLFVVAPVVLLVPVWLGAGFTLKQAVVTAWELAKIQIGFTLMAMLLAALVEDVGKFFVAALLLTVALLLLGSNGPTWRWTGLIPAELHATRNALIGLGEVTLAAILMPIQFLTRRTDRTWAGIGVGLAAALAIRLAWPWEMPWLWMSRPNYTPPPAWAYAGHAAVQRVGTAQLPREWGERVLLGVEASGFPAEAGIVAAVRYESALHWGDGLREKVNFASSDANREEQARRLLHLPPFMTTWELASYPVPLEVLQKHWRTWKGPATYKGDLQLATVRGSMAGPVPLVAGAELRDGACCDRVVLIDLEPDGERVTILLEEHDRRDDGPDCYALTNAALGWNVCLVPGRGESAELNGFVLSTYRLTIKLPTRTVNGREEVVPDWARQTMLTRVRIEQRDRFVRHVEFDPMTLNPAKGEAKP